MANPDITKLPIAEQLAWGIVGFVSMLLRSKDDGKFQAYIISALVHFAKKECLHKDVDITVTHCGEVVEYKTEFDPTCGFRKC